MTLQLSVFLLVSVENKKLCYNLCRDGPQITSVGQVRTLGHLTLSYIFFLTQIPRIFTNVVVYLVVSDEVKTMYFSIPHFSF